MGVILKTSEWWQCLNPACEHEWLKREPVPPRQCPKCLKTWWFSGVKENDGMNTARHKLKPLKPKDLVALT